MLLHGGCACGAVRYEVTGTPYHCTLCHCIDCRRAAGAPALAWFSVPARELAWVAGTPALHRSSPPVERGFCGRCSTQLTWRSDAVPGEIDVTTCSLDDPEAAPPEDHTFAAQRVRWMHIGAELPSYQRSRAECLKIST